MTMTDLTRVRESQGVQQRLNNKQQMDDFDDDEDDDCDDEEEEIDGDYENGDIEGVGRREVISV